SPGTLYSGYHIYDAIDLVTTSSITNAPRVTSITFTPAQPSVGTGAQKTFVATAKDQFNNVTPANFIWSDQHGTIDGAGNYTAPATVGSDTVTATSGTVSGSTTVNVFDPSPIVISDKTTEYLTRQAVDFTFDRNVAASLIAGDLLVENVTTQTTIPASSI